MAVPCSDDNSDYNISREIYKSHQTQLEDILTTSDITRNSLASRLYENRLISEKVMDIIHKNKKEDQDLAALLLRELRLKIETHFEDILKIMKTEESLRSIAIKMRNQFIPMATPFSPIETTSPVYNRSTSDPESPIFNLQRRIGETHDLELYHLALNLQRHFDKLLMATSRVLKQEDVDEFKMNLSSILHRALMMSLDRSAILKYIEALQPLNSIPKIFTYLKIHHFIGYLNYMLLKELLDTYEYLSPGDDLTLKFEAYERDCLQLLEKSSFRDLIKLYGNYPQLCPRVPTGLPEVWFKCDDRWNDSSVKTFHNHLETHFNWLSGMSLKGVKDGCVLLTFVVWRLEWYNRIMDDLSNHDIVSLLKKDGITVTTWEMYKKEQLYRQLYGSISTGDVVHTISLLRKEGTDINVKFKPDMCLLSNSESLLHLAVDTGQMSSLEVLINFEADINITNRFGKTPLYYAIRSSKDQMVQTLLQQGARIDEDGGSYMHYFVETGQVQVITKLLSSGQANANMTDNLGNTPLHSAIKSGHFKVIEALLKHGVNTTIHNKRGWTPLYLAAIERDQNIFNLLLNNNVDPHYTDHNGCTYLHHAASSGNLKTLQLFVQNTMNLIDALDKNGKTPLHLAAENGHENVAKFLLQNGVQVNLKDMNGKAPLHYAADNGHTEMIEVLVHYKADINIEDMELRTPLHIAAGNDDLQTVQVLLSWFADLKRKANDGWTPLMQAAWSGHHMIVKELLSHDSSNIDERDKDGSTPLKMATVRGHSQVVDVLIQYGADYTIMNADKWSLLHVAAQRGHPDVVKVLLDKGFDVNIQDIHGWSAFNTALVKAHTGVAKTMMEFGAIVDIKEKEDGKTSIHHAVDSQDWPNRYSVVELLLTHKNVNPNAVDNDGLTPLHYAVNRENAKLVKLLLERGGDPSLKDKYEETPVDYAQDKEEILKIFDEFL